MTKKKSADMHLILRYLKKHLTIFLVSTFFLVTEAITDFLQPAFMASIVDKGVKDADIPLILHYGLIMVFIALVGAFSAVMRNLLSSYTSQAIGKELRNDMYRHIMTLSMANIDRLSTASLITRITNDVSQIQTFINSMMRMMVKAPIICIGAIILIIIQMPAKSPLIALILIITFAIITAILFVGYPKFGRVQRSLDKLNTVSREFLSSIRVVKAFNAEETEREHFGSASSNIAKANTSALETLAIFSPLINLTVNFGTVILLWTSRREDASNIGHLMAVVNYMTLLLFALTRTTSVLNTAVRALASSKRIEEVLNEKPSLVFPSAPTTVPDEGSVSFRDLSFTYTCAQKAALEHISLEIKSGTLFGIIGPTGAGKSTLVNLIPRLYEASEGQVLINNTDIRMIDPVRLHSLISIVPQKALLFTGTIKDNLKWGNQNAGDEETTKAADIAEASSFITATPDGYETKLGQGGVNLSGGQKQRLTIARALLGHPRILILDDATSALDADTEEKVLTNLKAKCTGMTIILISQRISTVMQCDHILCMEDGKAQGCGTHQELMRECNTYREIYRSEIGEDTHAI